MSKNICASILSIVIVATQASSASANSENSNALKRAVETIYDVDANGQAFTMSVAAFGGAGAIGVGAWVGLEMALAKDSQHTTTGWVLTGLGLVSTGIGAVHFFGKTRAQRELHKALHPDDPVSNFSLDAGPTLVMGPRGELAPGLLAVGTF